MRPKENISKKHDYYIETKKQKMLRNKNFRRHAKEHIGNNFINKI